MEKIKNYFKDWTLYDYVFVVTAFTATLLCTVLFNGNIFGFFSSFLGIVTALFSSKGKWYAYVFGIIALVFYSIVSFISTNYGELLLSIIIVLPMYIYTLITWFKNKDAQNDVVVNKLSIKETSIVLAIQVILFFVYYFILKAFNTPVVIVATFSILTRTLALYFLSRRSPLGYFSYISNDILTIVIWSIPMFNGDLSYLSVIINFAFSLVNDICAVFRWSKLQKKQNIELNIKELEEIKIEN